MTREEIDRADAFEIRIDQGSGDQENIQLVVCLPTRGGKDALSQGVEVLFELDPHKKKRVAVSRVALENLQKLYDL